MVKDGYVVSQEEEVWVRRYGGLDVWNGRGAGDAALGLEELDYGEGFEGYEAGGGVGVSGVFGDGMAGVVEGDVAGHGGLFFAEEEGF